MACPLQEFAHLIAMPFLGGRGGVTTVSFLEHAENFVQDSFTLLRVIVSKLAPLLVEVTFELYPFPLKLIRVHGFPLLWDRAGSVFVSIWIFPPQTFRHRQYREEPGNSLLTIAQAEGVKKVDGQVSISGFPCSSRHSRAFPSIGCIVV